MKKRSLAIRVFMMLLLMNVTFMVMFFLPAGTFDFWQAWVYIVLITMAMLVVSVYLLKNDPDLLERRMRFKERNPSQKLIILVSYPIFILAFMLPGFDRRFGWSNLIPAISIAADVIVMLAYGFVFWVFRVNSYTSRVIEVEAEQQVITTGPYALVRHPMYLGSGILYIFTPLALGSWVAVFPTLLYIPVLMFRILDEEKTLSEKLKGYQEYMQKIKYRLIPGLW